MLDRCDNQANDDEDIWDVMEQHDELVEPWALDGPEQWFNQDVDYADYYQDELESIVSLEDVRLMNFDSVEISDDDDDDDAALRKLWPKKMLAFGNITRLLLEHFEPN